jgi:hypothetical protein
MEAEKGSVVVGFLYYTADVGIPLSEQVPIKVK